MVAILERRRTVIVGGGVAGLALSALLSRHGRRVCVLEKYHDPRLHAVPRQPSINLALSHRGIGVLARLGVLDSLRPHMTALHGRMIHDRGETRLQRYDLVGDRQIFSVRRSDLLRLLLNAAEAAGVRIEFDNAVADLDLVRRRVTVHARDGSSESRRFSVIIGADGSHSVVRAALDAAHTRRSRMAVLEHGYCELPIRREAAAGLEPHALHVWPRDDFMLIALPNSDGAFTATLFLPREGPASFAALRRPGAPRAFFETHFADVAGRCGGLERAFEEGHVGTITTGIAANWAFQASAVLVGDAAHSITPFFGQGVNCALEDCGMLADLMEHSERLETAFDRFRGRRVPDALAIAELSLANHREMRRSVREVDFEERREARRQLQLRFPGRFVPLYSMVSFSDIPYSECLRRHRIQEALVTRVVRRLRSGRPDWHETRIDVRRVLGDHHPGRGRTSRPPSDVEP